MKYMNVVFWAWNIFWLMLLISAIFVNTRKPDNKPMQLNEKQSKDLIKCFESNMIPVLDSAVTCKPYPEATP